MIKLISAILMLIAMLFAGYGVVEANDNATRNGSGPDADLYTKILYTDDFESTSSPSYSVVFGKPRIVGPIGQMTTNSLELNSSGNPSPFYYDQIQYSIDQRGSPYEGLGRAPFHVSFDVMTSDLKSSNNRFVVSFDTPITYPTIDYTGDLNLHPPKIPTIATTLFVDNVKYHVDIYFDIGHNVRKICIDKEEIISGEIKNGETLRSIRFTQGARITGDIDFNATTYIDNIKISTVP